MEWFRILWFEHVEHWCYEGEEWDSRQACNFFAVVEKLINRLDASLLHLILWLLGDGSRLVVGFDCLHLEVIQYSNKIMVDGWGRLCRQTVEAIDIIDQSCWGFHRRTSWTRPDCSLGFSWGLTLRLPIFCSHIPSILRTRLRRSAPWWIYSTFTWLNALSPYTQVEVWLPISGSCPNC